MLTKHPESLKHDIWKLLTSEKYFTHGTIFQINRMIKMSVLPEYTYRDIAMMIFICSDIPVGEDLHSVFSDIQNQIESIWIRNQGDSTNE